MNSPCFFGLDAGNTKTAGAVVGADGAVLALASGGCGDYQLGGKSALATLHEVTRTALTQAGADISAVAGAAFCLAGADWPEDFATLEAHFATLGWTGPTRVFNDAQGALRGCSVKGEGLALVCGTYTTVAARSASGATWFAGPWGTASGATQIGRRGLDAVIHAQLGLAPPTAIVNQLQASLGLPDANAVVHRYTSGPESDRPSIGEIAPAVVAAADRGDRIAAAMLEQAAAEVILMGRAAVQATGLVAPFPVFLSGGMHRVRNGAWVDTLSRCIRETFPGAPIRFSPLPPLGGAVLLAFETAGRPVTTALLERVKDSLDTAVESPSPGR